MNSTGEFKKVLTLFPIVMFGLAYMVPMTVFTTYGIVSQVTEGMLPAAYVITLIAMLFTAYSYGRMVKAYPYSGSAYTYSQKSLNPHIGFFTGWVLLLDYLFLPMVNYLVIGIYLTAEFPSVPTWVWILSAIAIVTFLNIRGIKVVTNVNFFLIIFQILVIVFFFIFSIHTILNGGGTGQLFSASPFFKPDGEVSLVFTGAAILCLSFLGFDAVTTLSEEAVDAKKTIPKAIFLVTIIGGVLFILVSYIGHQVYPDYTSFTDPDSASLDIAVFIGGHLFKAFFLAAYVLGCFASATSSHASVSRVLFAMGRDTLLPKKIFGKLSQRFRTPVNSTVIVSVCALSSLVFTLETVSSFISFGALAAFTMVHCSVISHYFIRGGQRSFVDSILYLVLPLIGILLCVWLWTSLSQQAFILGIGWIVLGFIYLLFLTNMFKKRPPEMSLDKTA